jgi:peptidoglycan/LPS O-acetylase OafA/YrhL
MAKKEYFESLDGLRTLSFLFVFFSHAFVSELVNSLPSSNIATTVFFRSGGEGVSIFFVISGFLISYLLFKEESSKGMISLKKFYLRRVFRIWPLFYLVVLYALFLFPLMAKIAGIEHVQTGSVFLNLVCLNNFDVLNLIQNNGLGTNTQLQITWSVAIEEQFYLIWPLIFLVIRRIKFRNFIFPLLLILSFVFRMLNHDNHEVNYFHTFAVFGDLVLGGWMGFLVFYNDSFRKVFVNMRNNVRSVFYTIGIIIFSFRPYLMELIEYDCLFRYITILIYSFVILDQCFNKSTWLKLSNLKLLTSLGKYTYGLYLLHPIAILYCKHIFDFFNLNYINSWAFAILLCSISFICTLIMAKLSYNYFESYFLKIKTKYSTI